MEKFKCLGCGDCCRDFKGRKEININPPCFMSDNPIVIAYSYPNLLIHDWEKEVFDKEDLIPLQLVFDTKNNQSIILSYSMNKTPCPHLNKENKCNIYDKRPIICRYFPFDHELFGAKAVLNHKRCRAEVRTLDEARKMFGVNIGEKTSRSALLKKSYERYGDCAIAKFVNHSISGACIQFLVKSEQEGKIRLARKGYDMKYLIKRIDSNPKVDVSDLIFEQTGKKPHEEYMSKENLEKIRHTLEKN